MSNPAAVSQMTMTQPSPSTGAANEPPVHIVKGLARKVTCSVVTVVCTGVIFILLLQVGLIVSAVPDWGGDAKDRMIDLEQENILKLASDKAEYVTEIFGRVEEGILQEKAFAEQALLEDPETMVVQNYLRSFSGLEQSITTWDHSVWFITALGVGEFPASGSSLEGLLNRTSLMDVPFRAMQRQHLLVYAAALDDPSPPAGEVSNVSMQVYAGFDMEEAGFLNHTDQNGCDARFDSYGDDYLPDAYDPRCRPWYQDAIEDGNTAVIFTNPYPDAGSGLLTVTVATPVYDPTNSTLLMGVVGLDMNFTDIEASIDDLTIIDDDDGYAYLLAPGGEGEVAVHFKLDYSGGTQFIVDLEEGVDEDEFGDIVVKMSEECTGVETYSKNDDTWILSWKHETVSGADSYESDSCGDGGFIAVVTVKESALLKEFSQMERDVRYIVVVASVVMVVVLVVITFCTIALTIAMSKSIVEPINQLIDVVHSLYTMDFTKHALGRWIVNETSSPEVEELMEAFKAMSTVVKAANINLRSGDLQIAEKNYVDALILFKKLENERGVAITNNNLGILHTLQAKKLEDEVAIVRKRNQAKARQLAEKARSLYADAVTNYGLAIADAEMVCAAVTPQNAIPLPLPAYASDVTKVLEGETKDVESAAVVMSETRVAGSVTEQDVDDTISKAELFLQLSNRKFNLAVCLVAKAKSAIPKGGHPDSIEIDQARNLLNDCVRLTVESQSETGDVWRVKYLLELATLERGVPGHHREANEALDAAERVIAPYRENAGDVEESTPRFSLTVVLPQRLLAARAANRLATGDTVEAIKCWTQAIVGSGDKMDVGVVHSSLEALRRLALRQQDVNNFPPELLAALGLPTKRRTRSSSLVSAIDDAFVKIEKVSPRTRPQRVTDVDLCFVMDCTGSMQRWVDQAKNKLTAIIEEAKKHEAVGELRVAFIGYRDFGYTTRYEGPYDFHTEEELTTLLAKIKTISTSAGPRTIPNDLPEDAAGGLHHALQFSWRSPVRLCTLIADMPCHGRKYHRLKDNYPDGCPSGRDPAKLLDELQHNLGVDFYFVRITHNTDKMISVLKNSLASSGLRRQHHSRDVRGVINTSPAFKVHNLGSNDNRFLETMVESVKESVDRLPLILEE